MIPAPTEISISSETGLVPEFTIKVLPNGIAVLFSDGRVWSRTYNEMYERSESIPPDWL